MIRKAVLWLAAGLRYVLLTLLVLTVAVVGAFKALTYYARSQEVPSELGAGAPYYVSEKSWGFGPGGNETAIYVYALPREVAQKIVSKGLRFFPHDYRWNWRETPVAIDHKWKIDEDYKLDIKNYLGKYGFEIDIDADVVNAANRMISDPGNFYTYSRTGLIIVSPTELKVIFAHAG